MRVLIDGDPLVYRAGFAAETTEYAVHWTDDEFEEEITVWFPNAKAAKEKMAELLEVGYEPMIEKRVTPEDVRNALYNVRSMVETTCRDLCAGLEDVTIFLSGPENFRIELATLKPYKGNRDETHKPIHGPAIKEFMLKTYNTVVSDGCEADDELSITQHECLAQGEDSVICTLDKDLDMVPGFHYNFVKRELYHVDPADCLVYFYRQMLTGDTVDNIPGIKGIGPVKAQQIIPWPDEDPDPHVTEQDWYDRVRALYVQTYGEEKADEALLEVGRLLWMQTKRGEMWIPPS